MSCRHALLMFVATICAALAVPERLLRASGHREITTADRNWWSFQPIANPPAPAITNSESCRNDIDRFILARLEAEGISPAPQADRITLIRRATFDLTGLPPTPAEARAFVADPSPLAYEHLIDRLLASPGYGQHWARHWLDLVRYAESDGFKSDEERPNAWPYRDYVIRSFNDDKPYDRFVTEQLAGDELAPNDPNVIVATGYLRAGLYEYNQRDVARQWSEMLNDVTDVTADVFLGLSIGCARCHDHKFDPILRSDYYRLQAFFAPMLPRDDLPLATAEQLAAHQRQQAEWEKQTAGIGAELAPIQKRAYDTVFPAEIRKFPPETQAILYKPADQRTPLEKQWTYLAMRQVADQLAASRPEILPHDKAAYESLHRKLLVLSDIEPTELFRGLLMTDVGPIAPPTYVPGDTSHPLAPGSPLVLDGLPIRAGKITATETSTGRRLALARWIVQPANPLTSRVMVNRIWQYHFGCGLVATSGDFGHLGSAPSHPELLDYLARRFIDGGWSLKTMHRLIMTSATYRQASVVTPSSLAKLKDPDNRWLWRMNARRLEAEEIRDAMLAVSGELDATAGGPSAAMSEPRRSIYSKLHRNNPNPLLEAFDAPEAFGCVPIRNQTTTPTQALLMINGEEPLNRARALAARVRKEAKSSETDALIDVVYSLAYNRAPRSDELELAVHFLRRDAKLGANLEDFCHVILNSSEFLYVD